MTSPSESAAGPVFGRPARGALLGGRQGLSTTGATLLILLIGGAGSAYDVLRGGDPGLVFAICFVAASALSGLLVDRRHLLAAVVLVPLTYLLLAVAAGIAGNGGAVSGVLSKQAVGLLNALVLGAPVLVGATAAAAVVCGLRALGGRQGS